MARFRRERGATMPRATVVTAGPTPLTLLEAAAYEGALADRIELVAVATRLAERSGVSGALRPQLAAAVRARAADATRVVVPAQPAADRFVALGATAASEGRAADALSALAWAARFSASRALVPVLELVAARIGTGG